MSLILHIDTATENAYVNIAQDGVVIAELLNNEQKDHAGFLQPAIQQIVKKAGIQLKDIDAVAVASGPGSYTGLRVGMASAKGLCYALNKPLITVTTLHILAKSVLLQNPEIYDQPNALICPMIDARRMEVFTAMYNIHLKSIVKPTSLILDNISFITFLQQNVVFFTGNGINKWKSICDDENAFFIENTTNSEAFAQISFKKWQDEAFSELVYTEPEYIKEFYTK